VDWSGPNPYQSAIILDRSDPSPKITRTGPGLDWTGPVRTSPHPDYWNHWFPHGNPTGFHRWEVWLLAVTLIVTSMPSHMTGNNATAGLRRKSWVNRCRNLADRMRSFRILAKSPILPACYFECGSLHGKFVRSSCQPRLIHLGNGNLHSGGELRQPTGSPGGGGEKDPVIL